MVRTCFPIGRTTENDERTVLRHVPMGLMGYSVGYGKVGLQERRFQGLSSQAELARRALNLLTSGQQLSADQAVQLRLWAVHPEDTFLPLEDIANGILAAESKPSDLPAGDPSGG